MSQENVETVRRQFEAFNSGDLDEAVKAYDRDVVVVAPEGWPDGDVNRGIDAWRRQVDRLLNTWADARIEIEELRPIGNRVVARIRYVTQSAETGLPFDTPLGALFLLRDGIIEHAQYFWQFSEALEAAGLSE